MFEYNSILIRIKMYVPNAKYMSPAIRAITIKPARMTIEVASKMYVHLYFYKYSIIFKHGSCGKIRVNE